MVTDDASAVEETEIELPNVSVDTTLPDLFVRLEINLLVPDDVIDTDRHHPALNPPQRDGPHNETGDPISPFTPAAWLQHGCEQVLKISGVSACYPDESGANHRSQHLYEQIPSVQEEVQYCQLNIQVSPRDAKKEPLGQASREVIGNLEGTWRLRLQEPKPEYVGLLVEAVDHMSAYSDEYARQFDETQNFGAELVDARVINPLFTDDEIRRASDQGRNATAGMQTKDDVWREHARQQFVQALQERITAADAYGGDA